MTPKPDPNLPKTSLLKPVRKPLKETIDSGRLFVDVDQFIRKSQRLPLTRYVE